MILASQPRWQGWGWVGTVPTSCSWLGTGLLGAFRTGGRDTPLLPWSLWGTVEQLVFLTFTPGWDLQGDPAIPRGSFGGQGPHTPPSSPDPASGVHQGDGEPLCGGTTPGLYALPVLSSQGLFCSPTQKPLVTGWMSRGAKGWELQ